MLVNLLCCHLEKERLNTARRPLSACAVSLASAGGLYDSVRSGEPAFSRVFGQQFFEYLANHPADAAIFNTVMTQGIAWTTPALLAAYDFSRFKQLVDVGGGQGALLRDILIATPGLEGISFRPSAGGVRGIGDFEQRNRLSLPDCGRELLRLGARRGQCLLAEGRHS
jgi:hypothetical protein